MRTIFQLFLLAVSAPSALRLSIYQRRGWDAIRPGGLETRDDPAAHRNRTRRCRSHRTPGRVSAGFRAERARPVDGVFTRTLCRRRPWRRLLRISRAEPSLAHRL